MSFAIQTMGPSGNVLLDTSERLARVVGVWTIAGAQVSPSIWGAGSETYWYTSPVFVGLANDGSWFVDAPATKNEVRFIGGGQFQICFASVGPGRSSDVPVTIWRC